MRRYWPVALVVLLLDRASKIAAKSLLPAMPGGSYPLMPGVIHLTYAENTGVAFSMLQIAPWMLALLTFLVLVAAALALRRWVRPNRLNSCLVWALLGGGLGNCIDRLLYGYVVDFIELRFVHFAIFNVADIAVTVSCILLALMTAFEKNGEEHGKDSGKGRFRKRGDAA